MEKINVITEIKELKNQLSYSKRYAFFFGAGTSCALGVPNIATLTSSVEDLLKEKNKENFKVIKQDLESSIPDKTINIEDILNQIRQIRMITREREDKKYLEITGKSAKELDNSICKSIYEIISQKESDADLTNTKRFFAWLSMQNKNYSSEVFTSNYDMIIEKSLEGINYPYFDGFVGAYEPFFWQESIDKFVDNNDLTKDWIRLWKIHGSLNWFWKVNDGKEQIIRGSKISDIRTLSNELVIYPSKEKYNSSRKQPFVSYFERLKKVLTSGEVLFVFSGYSFSDQHINDIVFDALRQNNRLHIVVFSYLDEEVENLYKILSSYLNISVYGPQKAILRGNIYEWNTLEQDEESIKTNSIYWDNTKKSLTIGDFNKLVDFLIKSSGNVKSIEDEVNGK